MTRHIDPGRAEGNGFTVRVLGGARDDRTDTFTEHAEAVAFAQAKMGRAGTLRDRTTTTEEHLDEHRACGARARAALQRPVP